MPVSCYKGVLGENLSAVNLRFMDSWIPEELFGVDGQFFKVTELVCSSHTMCLDMTQKSTLMLFSVPIL